MQPKRTSTLANWWFVVFQEGRPVQQVAGRCREGLHRQPPARRGGGLQGTHFRPPRPQEEGSGGLHVHPPGGPSAPQSPQGPRHGGGHYGFQAPTHQDQHRLRWAPNDILVILEWYLSDTWVYYLSNTWVITFYNFFQISIFFDTYCESEVRFLRSPLVFFSSINNVLDMPWNTLFFISITMTDRKNGLQIWNHHWKKKKIKKCF